jgi:hypothetical protein
LIEAVQPRMASDFEHQHGIGKRAARMRGAIGTVNVAIFARVSTRGEIVRRLDEMQRSESAQR